MTILKRIESAIVNADTVLNRALGLLLYVLFIAVCMRYV